MTVLNGFAIAANAVLVAILSAMGVRIAALVVEQYQSGYVPAYLPQVFGLAICSLALAAAVGAGVAVWLRTDRSTPRRRGGDARGVVALPPAARLPPGRFASAGVVLGACLPDANGLCRMERSAKGPGVGISRHRGNARYHERSDPEHLPAGLEALDLDRRARP